MEIWLQTMLEKFRHYRSEKLLPLGKLFLRWHLSANLMTLLSFLAGLGAVYFLFKEHIYFILLAVLHLLLDGIDGVIARASATSLFGKYFDYLSDQTVGFLLLLKIAIVTQDFFVYIIAALVFFSQLFYLLSRLKAPVFFPRTSVIILLFFNLITLAFLTAGVIGLYSLVMQLAWVVKKMVYTR